MNIQIHEKILGSDSQMPLFEMPQGHPPGTAQMCWYCKTNISAGKQAKGREGRHTCIQCQQAHIAPVIPKWTRYVVRPLACYLEGVGLDRAASHTRRGHRSKGPSSRTGKEPCGRTALQIFHIHSCKTEHSLARMLNLPWEEGRTYVPDRDVGGLIEVRGKDEKWRCGHLIVKPQNNHGIPTPPNVPYVQMLTIDVETYYARGWMMSHHAIDDAQYQIRRHPGTDPGYYIPQRNLLPMDALEQWVAENRHRVFP